MLLLLKTQRIKMRTIKNFLLNMLQSTLLCKELLSYCLLAFLGAFATFTLIYYRFLRDRVPKNIPFDLNELWAILLLSICVTYLYLILRTIKPKTPNALVIKILSILVTPFITLLSVIKNNKVLLPYYNKMIHILLEKIICPGYIRNATLVLLLKVIPKGILVTIFLLDVFLFQKL